MKDTVQYLKRRAQPKSKEKVANKVGQEREEKYTGSQTKKEKEMANVAKLEKAIQGYVETKSGFGNKRAKLKVIEKVFQEFDRDGSGLIDEEEFLAALVKLNVVGCTEDCLVLFDQFDQDMSGAISYREFIDYLFPNDEEKVRDYDSRRIGVETKTESEGEGVVARVKSRIMQLAGADLGIRGVTRILRQMDTDGSNSLNAGELKDGLQSFGIQTTGQDIRTLMSHFDRDGSGKISIEEFLRGLRGKMSRSRRLLIRQAWEQLVRACEKDGPGDCLTLRELLNFYDVSKNPEVINGSITEDDAMRNFLAIWDKNHDDKVDWKEFFDYYKDVSAGIDRDDYFELVVRNAWHLTGGQGWSENTSNIRCLVTLLNGDQKVVEIKNDFGVSRSASKPELMRLLQLQGIRDISDVTLHF